MKMTQKLAVVTLASLFSLSAFAVQKDITVTADIDPTVELLQADGTALPQSLKMTYLPGVGLLDQKISTKIYTNDANKAVQVRLLAEPNLLAVTNPSAPAIPLGVKFNGTSLTTTATQITAAALFPAGLIDTGSVPMDLVISQKKQEAVKQSGSYQGVVSLVLNLEATAP